MTNATKSTQKTISLPTNDRATEEIWHRMYCEDATDDEFRVFLNTIKRTGLSPESRQIYARMQTTNAFNRKTNQKEWTKKLIILLSIDGFRLIAQRTGKYAGQKTALYSKDGKCWVEAWNDDQPPGFAKVGVLRHDFIEPLFAVAKWKTFVQTYTPYGSKTPVPNSFWSKMPEVMLAKVAEAQALRRAFPQELSGLYESSEIQNDDTPPPEPKPKAQQPTKPAKTKPKIQQPTKPPEPKITIFNPDNPQHIKLIQGYFSQKKIEPDYWHEIAESLKDKDSKVWRETILKTYEHLTAKEISVAASS